MFFAFKVLIDMILKYFCVLVLSLRNLCGEGTSLTHEEWNVLHPILARFSEEFATFLLESSNVPTKLVDARAPIIGRGRGGVDQMRYDRTSSQFRQTLQQDAVSD